VAIASPRRTFTSMPSIIFRVMNAASEGHQHYATHPTAVADLETEMAVEDGSEMTGPARTRSSDKQPYSF